jgi:hypothetical protein
MITNRRTTQNTVLGIGDHVVDFAKLENDFITEKKYLQQLFVVLLDVELSRQAQPSGRGQFKRWWLLADVKPSGARVEKLGFNVRVTDNQYIAHNATLHGKTP